MFLQQGQWAVRIPSPLASAVILNASCYLLLHVNLEHLMKCCTALENEKNIKLKSQRRGVNGNGGSTLGCGFSVCLFFQDEQQG